MAPSEPAIKPWLPRIWRDPDILQIGVDPSQGVLVSGLDAATARWLTGIDGSRSEAEILAEATAVGLDVASAVRILSGLRRSGVLLPAPLDPERGGDTGRLVPELVDLTGALTSARNGLLGLQARQRRHILIDGANRIGVPLGALLAASGIGRLSFLDAEHVRRCDASVGGLSLQDEGEARAVAALGAVRRISPLVEPPVEPAPPPPVVPPDEPGDEPGKAPGEAPAEDATRVPDLVVLCRPWTAHDPLHSARMAERTTHLTVAIRDGTAVVGPLVVPGTTSCLHCAELHRTDRDPRWPAVAAQLVGTATRAMHEPTSVLAALTAALAAAQVLDHVDGNRRPEVVEATLELRPPDWQLHRRSWPPHPECGCLRPAAGTDRVAS